MHLIFNEDSKYANAHSNICKTSKSKKFQY